MGTTTKALSLLDEFSVERPEIGLSDFARITGRDKATTHRLLGELTDSGFIEKCALTKLYRLGPAVLRLANVREKTFPIKKAAETFLASLVAEVKETAHVTLLQGYCLSPVHNHHSTNRATRVYIDESELLPLHATASGNVVMAFGSPDLLATVLGGKIDATTPSTDIDPQVISEKVMTARASGFGCSFDQFEEGVSSYAAPLFDADGGCTGAVAVAVPSARMTDDLGGEIRAQLIVAATAITKAIGGTIPAHLLAIWGRNDG